MRKRPNSLEMLAQVMAQMSMYQEPKEKLPPAPKDTQTIYVPSA